MPVPVRPDVNEDTLRLLLAEGIESETLDYKSYCDLSISHEAVELAKDIAAMQIEGGYIVIGANDDATPSSKVEAKHLKAYEQASLRKQMLKYLAEPLTLLAKHHELAGNRYILIFVGPSDDCFSVIKNIGQNAKGNNVFQPGDVFARHGTSSERWNQHDISKIKARIVERQRESWSQEASRHFAATLEARASATIADAPASALNWQLDVDTFIEVVIEQMRKNDPVPLRLLLSSIPGEVSPILVGSDAGEKITVVLDRLTCLAALMLRLKEDELFRSAIEGLVSVYDLPVDGRGEVRGNLTIRKELVWFKVLQRIAAVGAFAERLKRWEAIRFLVLQKGRAWEFNEDADHYWYRQSLTLSSRADLLIDKESGRRRDLPLLAFALEQVERLDCLHSDLPAGDEGLLDSLCRFDLLACLIAIDAAKTLEQSVYYPNFARYHSRRSTPAAAELIDNPEMRSALFHGSDEDLAKALRELSGAASGEAYLINGWSGYRNAKVEQFIKEHRSMP